MNQPNTQKTYRELLEVLIELLSETEDESIEAVDIYLKNAGYDPDELVSRMRKRMKKAMDDSPLNWRNQSNQIQQNRNRLNSLKETVNGSIEEIKSEIKKLLDNSGQKLALHHRNLDLNKLDENDLDQLLTELKFQLQQQRDSSTEED